MLIIGAKGFAKEILEIFYQKQLLEKIFFYDDINEDTQDLLFDRFQVLKNIYQAAELFEKIDDRFTIGIGNPELRYRMFQKFKKIGGTFCSAISPFSNIGGFGNIIEEGVNIMTGTIITSSVTVSTGSLINLNCTIGHDSFIGKFVELAPGVHISGNCFLDDFCSVGSGAVILPEIKLGKNVVVGAGAVVNKNVDDNTLVLGIPAKVVRIIEPIYT